MKKLRVAHIVEAATTGLGKHVADIVRSLDTQRYEIHVLYSPLRMDSAFEIFVTQQRQRGVYFQAIPMVREISLLRDLRSFVSILLYLDRVRADVVHTHSSKAGMLGRIAAWCVGVPRRLYSPNAFAFAGMESGLKRTFYIWLERLAGLFTTDLIAVSQSEAEFARKVVPAGKVHLIRNAIDLLPPGPGELTKAALGIPDHHRIVTTVGRLSEQKNPQLLIESAGRVLAEIPDVTFLMVGDGPLRAECEALIRKLELEGRVRLLGFRTDVPHLLALSDLFTMSSQYEGLPYVLLEAMAIGIPVVCTRFPGCEDLVIHGQTGLSSPLRDPVALAANILRCLRNPQLAESMSQSAQARVRQNHSLQGMVRKIEEVYAGSPC